MKKIKEMVKPEVMFCKTLKALQRLLTGLLFLCIFLNCKTCLSFSCVKILTKKTRKRRRKRTRRKGKEKRVKKIRNTGEGVQIQMKKTTKSTGMQPKILRRPPPSLQIGHFLSLFNPVVLCKTKLLRPNQLP